MLETDAKKKLCPFKLGSGTIGDHPKSNGWNCEGRGCMGWEEWKDPIYEEGKSKTYSTPIEHKPKDPPQGHCGMIPPELNCNFG